MKCVHKSIWMKILYLWVLSVVKLEDCLGGQWCLYCWVWPICSLLPGNQQKGGSRILPFLLPCCWWGLPAQWSADFVDQTVNIWCRHLTFVVVQDECILPSSHSFCFFILCFKSMNHLYNCFILPGIKKKLIWNTLLGPLKVTEYSWHWKTQENNAKQDDFVEFEFGFRILWTTHKWADICVKG